MFFRFLLLFLSTAVVVLSTWAFVGSYKNADYVTSNYLMTVQVTNLNLSALLNAQGSLSKRTSVEILEAYSRLSPSKSVSDSPDVAQRDLADSATSLFLQLASIVPEVGGASSIQLIAASGISAIATNTDIANDIASLTSGLSVPSSVESLAAELLSEGPDAIIQQVVKNFNATELGFGDMYSVSYWGYCRGDITTKRYEFLEHLGEFGVQFDNSHVDWEYCNTGKPVYYFDVVSIIRQEVLRVLEKQLSDSAVGDLSAILLSFVLVLGEDSIELPGDLKSMLKLLHNLTIASFAFVLAGICITFLSIVVQLIQIGVASAFLHCIQMVLMLLLPLCVLLGSAFATGVFIFVRSVVNDNVKQFGLESFLSVQFYAFSWSAVAAAFLLLIVNILGYCCGSFFRRKRKPQMGFNMTQQPKEMYYQ